MGSSLYYPNPIAAGNFLAVLCLAVFSVWGLTLNPRARTNKSFFFMCLHALVWQLGIGFMLCSRDPGLAERWYRVSYLGVVFICPGVLLFVSSIVVPQSRNKSPILIAYVLAFLFAAEGVLGKATITGVWEYSWGFYPRYGLLSAVFLSLFALLMLVIFRTLVRGLRTVESGFERRQIKALILAFSIAYLAALDFLPCFGVAVYPPGFAAIIVFVTLMFWSIYRYRLLDPTPESLAKKVLSTIADSIIVLDSDGVIRMVNPKAEELLGYTRKQLLQRHFASFVDPRSVDASQALVHGLGVRKKDVESGVITLRDIDGKSIPTACNLSAIRGWKGTVLGVVLACRDLQEIVRSKDIIQEQEEKIRDTQERYSALYNRSLFGVFVHSFDGEFLDANDAALEMLGYTREEIPSLNFATLLDDEDQLTEAIESLDQIKRTGGQKKLSKWKLKRKDGSFVWAETEAFLIYRGGKPYAIQGISHDITERVRTEQALRESEEKYRTVVDSSPESIVVVDPDGRIRSCNPAIETLTGYKPEELEGKYIHDLMTISSEEMPRVAEFFEDLMRGKEVESFELENIRKDGTKHWTSVKLGILKSGEEITGILVVSRDLTERKRMEEDLRESEERYRMLFESSPEAVTLIGLDGTILDCNQATTKLTGLPMEEIKGKSFVGLGTLHEDKMPEYMEIFSQLVRGESVKPLEHETIDADQKAQWTENYLSLLKRKNEPFAIQVISRDITERKRAEEELNRHHEHLKDLVEERTAALKQTNQKLEKEISERIQFEEQLRRLNEELDRRVTERTTDLEKANEELKELDRMKDSFLSSVSHELRTPLTSIRSFSEILLNYDEEDRYTQKEFLGIINSESERLTRLINDVLDLSRIEAGGMVWNDEVLSVEEIIRDILPAQQKLIEAKSLRLVLDLSHEPLSVFADRDRMQQVITNLLANAVKFSHEGGEIRVKTETFQGRRSEEPPQWIKVSISDQGIGIDEKDFDVIFDKFRQVTRDTLKDKPEGTGLGLPICRDIITHYGGNIWVESEQGRGSTFSFALPAGAVDGEAVCGDDQPVSEQSAPDRNGRTILVVEEKRSTRQVLRSQLERKGFAVMEASDADEALALARKEPIDLILLDLLMPSLSEDDLIGVFKDDPATENVPVLIISVVESPGNGILPGAHGFLRKPFREEELIHKVQALLEERNRSILVVDDDPGVRNSLRMQLEEMGYPVYLAENGDQAMDMLKMSVPDLVILDVIMPQKSGPEVLAWIRNNLDTRDLPVIILSGYPLFGELDRLRSLGIEAYVEKSENLSSLFTKIDSILEAPAH